MTPSFHPAEAPPWNQLNIERGIANESKRTARWYKPHIKLWWTTGGQQQQLIQDEEVDIIAMWKGRASESIINNGAHYEIVRSFGTSSAMMALRPLGS